MTHLQVPDNLAAELHDLAAKDHRAVESVLQEAISSYLSLRLFEPELSPEQIDRLKHSLAQAERGEFVSQEEVEAFFENWEKELKSR